MAAWLKGKGRAQKASYKSGLENDNGELLKSRGIEFEYEPKWGKIK